MDYDTFIGEVQNRARLSSREEALSVSRATLETLGVRVQQGDAENLAAQLPDELARHLTEAEGVESFGPEEFVDRVAEREELDPEDDRGDLVHHVRTVFDVLDAAASKGAMDDVRAQLSEEYDDLFELVDREDESVADEQQ